MNLKLYYKNKLIKNFYLFFVCINLISCDNHKYKDINSKEFWVNNSAITVKFDDQNYEIPANSGINVELSFDKHTITYNNEIIKFIVVPNDQNCIINPILSSYIFRHQMYSETGTKVVKDKPFSPYKTKFEDDTITVPLVLIKNKLFIEQDEYSWYLGITDYYKEEVSIIAKKENTPPIITKFKLFRLTDFLNYIGKENPPENFHITPKGTMELSELSSYEYIPNEAFTNCMSEKEDLEKLQSKFDSLQIITNPVRFRKIYRKELGKDIFKIYQEEVVIINPTKYNKECNNIFGNINKIFNTENECLHG